MLIALLLSEIAGGGTGQLSSQQKNEFLSRARVIEDMYNRMLSLSKVKVKGVVKVAISLKSERSPTRIFGPLRGFSSVVNILPWYDFDSYFRLNDHERNESILSVIHSSLQAAASEFNWNVTGINAIPKRYADYRFVIVT